ncbi:hypothetical protein Ddye_005636 [Dipteronia dyeriana]|uniref:Uncharacterized protein n=1 Tax=Dipteronia dyeriana TaxID=168575 RepID=A0AAD9XGU7_9ROSI|nr:hypothetical protein Ddye_005636 [Dipteronia dyeriana]
MWRTGLFLRRSRQKSSLVMVEEENLEAPKEVVEVEFVLENEPKRGCCGWFFLTPIDWIKMQFTKTHWSFVFGVVVVCGISQGLGGALARVATDYYMKDVQKFQPSEAQVYAGITSIPWIVKPLWGLLTDVLPISGISWCDLNAIGVIARKIASCISCVVINRRKCWGCDSRPDH